jgi:hypothetical protein
VQVRGNDHDVCDLTPLRIVNRCNPSSSALGKGIVFPVGLVGLPKLQRLTMRKGVKSQTSDNEDAEEQADTTREKKE